MVLLHEETHKPVSSVQRGWGQHTEIYIPGIWLHFDWNNCPIAMQNKILKHAKDVHALGLYSLQAVGYLFYHVS